MLQAFKNYISKHHLCSRKQKILVAVSGGVDSVVLLNLFLKAGYHIAIAHCNFKLRGNESDEDELFVKKLAEEHQIELFTKVCPASDYANQQHISIQEAARDLRYGFFDELAAARGFDKVAVAHHADDDLETFLINMMRGSGLQGIKGISVQRNNIIRPLMFASRSQIETYAVNNGIIWRDDSSNNSDKYLRNNIRHHLLPEFKKINADLTKIYDSLNNLKEDALVLKTLLEKEKQNIFIKNKSQNIIPFKQLEQKLPLDIWLYYLLKNFGFPRSETGKIADAVNQHSTGKHFFSETHELLIDRNDIIIRQKESINIAEYKIDEETRHLTIPFKAAINVMPKNEMDVSQLKDANAAYLDFDKLTFPLTLRKWQKNDRFQPYGMKGKKLLSDYFTDLKLSLFEKEKIWLLLSDNVVVWVTGKRIADPFKVLPGTKKVWCMKLSSSDGKY